MILETLAQARSLWSSIVQLAYPLYGGIPVIEKPDPQSPSPMDFYTDKERIFVCVNHPEKVEEDWLTRVVPLYQSSASVLYPGAGGVQEEELAQHLWLDTLLFVLFHELYHPLVCPNSLQDEKAVSQALYRGFQESLPGLSSAELLERVNQVKNLAWDVLVNVTLLARLGGVRVDRLVLSCTRVFARSQRRLGVRPVEVIPLAVAPALYYLSARNATTDILISIMGALYTSLSVADAGLRENLLDAFRAEGQRLNCPEPPEELALALLQEMTLAAHSLPEIRQLRSTEERTLRLAQRTLLADLLMLFEHPEQRYRVVEVIGKFLAPFLRGTNRQGSIDSHTRGCRPSPGTVEGTPSAGEGLGDTLEDLLETLPQEEADDVLGRLTQPAAGEGGDAEGGVGWNNLTLLAADEFYKQHSTPLSFVSPHSKAVRYDLGKQKQWRLKSTQTLTSAEVAQLDLHRVWTFQATTGLPVFLPLMEGYYQLNEFVLRETPIRTYVLRSEGVVLPDNWVLLVDSSGSMANLGYVGSGDKYDVLMRVCYGVARGLVEVAQLLKKDLHFGVVNFSSTTTFSGMQEFGKAFAERLNPIKQTLLIPQCGSTMLEVKVLQEVETALPPGQTIYTLITDGEIDNGEEVVEYLTQWCAHPGRALVFIEVGVASQVGESLRQLTATGASVVCFQVEGVEQIEQVLGSMLIRYT